MAWTLKNAQTADQSTSPMPIPAFTNPLTNPSIIFAGIVQSFSIVSDTITDTAGNTYIDCGAGVVVWNTNWCLQLWYALNTSTTASNIIQAANPSLHGTRIAAMEFTGGAISSPVDVTHSTPAGNTGVGGGQNMTTGAATTTANGELIVGWGTDTTFPSTNDQTVGTGFTTSGFSMLEYQVQASLGSIAATWSAATNSIAYGAIMATFKAAASGSLIGETFLFRNQGPTWRI